MKNFRSHLRVRGYLDNLVNRVLPEVKFTDRKSELQQKPQKVQNGLVPFVTQYNPSVPNLKNTLMSKWHLIENQPLLREIYREPPLISYKRGKSLGDILVRAKDISQHETAGVVFSLSTPFNLMTRIFHSTRVKPVCCVSKISSDCGCQSKEIGVDMEVRLLSVDARGFFSPLRDSLSQPRRSILCRPQREKNLRHPG